jgi:hypothetical protein
MLDSEFCNSHRYITKEEQKKRWFDRYILGKYPFRMYYHTEYRSKTKVFYINTIFEPIRSGSITLTKEDILKIPSQARYIDIYLLFLELGFVKQGTHKALECLAFWYYADMIANDRSTPLGNYIKEHLILSSGKAFFEFLIWIGATAMGRPRLTAKLVTHIPTLLDSDAAKELSWFSYDELDKIRIAYEKEPGKEHPLTKCLVQRWLLDLKELYQTEKAIQKIKMNQCKEELMMNRWHPDRLRKYLDMGYSIDELDDVM